MDQGAHFVRTDFQVHTPRDGNWQGERPELAADRAAFADGLVVACREKGIGAIAISDHHDLVYVPLVQWAAENETDASGERLPPEERLVVFPAIELTLGVPCQALLLLDAAFPVNRLSLVLHALGIDEVASELPALPPVTRLDHFASLRQLQDELDRNSWLRGAYIIFPNVTDGGHETLMRAHMQVKYKEMPCVGGYLDGSVSEKVGEGNRRIFAGKDTNWGNKRLALFQTSDSRNASFEALGAHTTWVKWAEPTAEALRQACLAEESRISHVPPELPGAFVTRMSVSNSMFMGPIELEFNSQYNAIIGGRGTGKSTCLEYLRWALCDQASSSTGDSELPDHAARRQRLIETTLAPIPGQVEVHFLVNELPHVVRRRSDSEEIQLKVGDEPFSPASEDDVRALLPIHAYSQKQLSSVSVRLEELTRFVTTPIRRTLEEFASRELELAGEIRANYAALQRQRALVLAVHRDELSAASLQRQADNLRGSLGGVSDTDRALLEQKPARDAAAELVAGLQRRLGQAEAEASEFLAGLEVLRLGSPAQNLDSTPDDLALEQMRTEVSNLVEGLIEVAREAGRMLARTNQEESAYRQSLAAWSVNQAEFEARYSEAKQRSSAHESKLEELEGTERRAQALRLSVAQHREDLARVGDPAAKHRELREAWAVLHNERSRLIEQQCDALTESSDGLIRATLLRGAGLGELAGALRGAVTGSSVRSMRIESFFEGLLGEEDPVVTWESALAELEAAMLSAEEGATDQAEIDTLARLGFSSADVERMAHVLSPEGWLGLALASPADHPKFEYRSKEGEYIDFTVASAGQQATALLRVLLSQGGPPLVIDQPEDDLDSQVQLEVVQTIWGAKKRRQLIFSSHNANLVVNGDAELVVCCDYRSAGDQSGGQLKLKGAIDIAEVRSEITQVMEGGERAFRLRKEKYGF